AALIKSGRANGAWNGKGIFSSAAATDEQRVTGLAVAINDKGGGVPILSSLNGAATDANSIIVKYTYNGDVDFNGKVDGADYFLVDSGFLNNGNMYRNGDLDFNAKVDGADYFLIDSGFLGQTQPLATHAFLAKRDISSGRKAPRHADRSQFRHHRPRSCAAGHP